MLMMLKSMRSQTTQGEAKEGGGPLVQVQSGALTVVKSV